MHVFYANRTEFIELPDTQEGKDRRMVEKSPKLYHTLVLKVDVWWPCSFRAGASAPSKIKSHFTDNEFLNNYIMDRYDGMCKHQKGFYWLEPGLY